MSRTLSFVDQLGKMGREVEFLVDTAAFHGRHGRKAKALVLLRRAAQTDGDNPEIVRRVADGLRELGELEEAGELLRLAMFRHPRDRRFRQLWERFRFQQVASRQQSGRPEPRGAVPILKFARTSA